jgi:CelD/BcsL family acetyltransferase involved in cellulose biosynthesis
MQIFRGTRIAIIIRFDVIHGQTAIPHPPGPSPVHAPRVPPVRARVLRDFGDPALSPPQWDRLLAAGTNNVFLTREWQTAWWSALGRGNLLLLAVEKDGQPVALAPLYSDQGMVYLVGSGFESYHLDFLGDTTDPGVVDALLAGAAESTPGFTGMEFYFISRKTQAQLESAAARLGFSCTELWRVASMTMDIAARPDVARAATRKKSLVRHENFYRRQGSLGVTHLSNGGEVTTHLDEMFTQHIRRWATTETPSLFTEERFRDFFRRWTEAAGARGWLRFTRLDWGGRAIAFHFGFRYGGRYIWYKPSFEIEEQRHSPGEVLLRQTLLAAIAEGAELFDFGTGDDSYKMRFADYVDSVGAVNISLPGGPG